MQSKSRRIGIITWHYFPNFGSALQAYALHTYINKIGGNAQLINYVPGKQPALWRVRLFCSYFDKYIPQKISSRIHYRFLAFEHKFFKETKLCTKKSDLKEIVPNFDIFICGSDQIWAPNEFDDVYMLSFVPDSKEKYSYAASIGLLNIPEYLRSTYKYYLSKFNEITVREKQGADLLRNQLGLKSTVVLDPTFLLNANDWSKIAIRKRNIISKYILCYFLGKTEEHRILVEKISCRMKLPVISISRYAMDIRPGFTTDTDAGPMEFLGYIKNAEIVVTDSFHGLCLSINMSKNVYVVERFAENCEINQNSRIYNILDILNMNDRLIRDMPMNIENIDYVQVQEKLSNERKKAYEFISSIVKTN